MKIPSFLLAALMASTVSMQAMAECRIVTTVDGTDTGRTLSKITFDGDMLTLVFSDSSTETVGMEMVSVTIDPDGGSGLGSIMSDPELPAGVYNLRGQRIADSSAGLIPGVYIVNGTKIFVK